MKMAEKGEERDEIEGEEKEKEEEGEIQGIKIEAIKESKEHIANHKV